MFWHLFNIPVSILYSCLCNFNGANTLKWISSSPIPILATKPEALRKRKLVLKAFFINIKHTLKQGIKRFRNALMEFKYKSLLSLLPLLFWGTRNATSSFRKLCVARCVIHAYLIGSFSHESIHTFISSGEKNHSQSEMEKMTCHGTKWLKEL